MQQYSNMQNNTNIFRELEEIEQACHEIRQILLETNNHGKLSFFSVTKQIITKRLFSFLSRNSTMTRDIDIANLSVCP